MARRRALRIVAALATGAIALAFAGCGDEDPSLPSASDPGIRFGYNADYQPGGPEQALLPASGAEVIRRRLSWQEIEPFPGAVDWTKYDVIYDELIAADTRPLWVLTDAPCFAAAPAAGCDPLNIARAVSTEHVAELTAFLTAATERYPESFGFEIGNEVNDEKFWTGGLDPAAYAVILRAATDAIHAVDPEMPVVSSGPFPFEEERPGVLPWRTLLAGIVDSGAAAEIDAIAFHPYVKTEPGEDPGPAVGALIDEVSANLEAAGAGNVPIWVTEVGLSMVGDPPLTAEQQAAGLVSIYEQLEERGIPVILIHRFQDSFDMNFPLEIGFGVVQEDSTPKPAFCALAAVRGEPCG